LRYARIEDMSNACGGKNGVLSGAAQLEAVMPPYLKGGRNGDNILRS
jgi:hypothetical protein